MNDPLSGRSIYATIRQDIVSLRLKPGTRLSENELAARFGTSRAPVREALIRLVDDGLIEVRPQRGSFVSKISLKAMAQARLVREALEVAIIRRAAERGMSAEAMAMCETALEGQRAARDEPERFTQFDDMFHRAFAVGAQLEGVWSIIEREKVQFDRVRILSLPAVTPVDVLLAQHRAILDAVLQGDPAAAEAALRLHLSEVLRIADDLAQRHPDLIDPATA
jgi:GntR family transcriptional regulator, rspAB operon transcriptional repressor